MEYIWISVYVKLDYLTYINLLRVFNNVKDIYDNTKDKDKFLKRLRSNCINISYNIFSNLVDPILKTKSIISFQNLCQNNIKVISLNSKYYPKQLTNIFNPPLAIFVSGNISLLKNKITYVYSSNDFIVNSKKRYYEFYEYMKENNISVVSDILSEYCNIIYLPYMQKIDRNDILVISDKLEENSYINYEYITGISHCLFIPESSHKIKVAMIVDLMLEQGKDILVIPGSIYNKEAYFSNHLIKEGAICITSKTDLTNYFR